MPFFDDSLFAKGTIIVDDSGNRAEIDAESLKSSSYWERISSYFNRVSDTSVAARGTQSLIDHTGKGFLIGVVLVTNSKDKMKLRIRQEDQTTCFDFTAEDVHKFLCMGLGSTTVSSGAGLGTNVWNPIESYYGIVFAPAQPLTYKEHLEVWIYNSDDAAHTILDAWTIWGQID